MISTEVFARRFLGYNIVGCAIRNRDLMYFIAREDYTQRPDWKSTGDDPADSALKRRVISYSRNKPEDAQWGNGVLTGFDRTDCGVSLLPREQLVVASISGQVYAVGSGEAGKETSLPRDETSRRGSLLKLKTIAGRLYMCGGNRTVAIRRGKDDWQWLTASLPFDIKTELYSAGFQDIDGFAEDDIYAAGGDGDVWHYDGARWRRIDFPTNLPLRTVCCAGDGRVYVSGYEGATFVGRGDRWRKLDAPPISLPFSDTVWHEGRVWASNDYGVWWISHDGIERADLDPAISACAGRISARDGVLLLAGFYGAAILEADGHWQTIMQYGPLAEQCEAEGRSAHP
ncbi:hypothetical protein GLE_3336 [Lysobacter enzymogenes]|uniref:Uncharacterized protein n=1 Tax=Lysobacter enzymogenes TaxID=69 RepID=A0A0S2DJF3_LYSEN|nr:hypothetical protein [Lysobacter enzymogenes]ALN58682.1 hypothetical protein GLE_3336 [Lysobacter enzymogenes]QCW27002.1 hypothetical protein FE772_16500 [Lysobacter enzymogenes]